MNDKTSSIAGLIFGGILGYVFWLYNWLNVVGMIQFFDMQFSTFVGIPLTKLIPGEFIIVAIGCIIGLFLGTIAGLSRTDY